MKLHKNLFIADGQNFDETLAKKNYEIFRDEQPFQHSQFVEDVVNPTIEFLVESIKTLKLDLAHERFKREELTIELQKYIEVE